MFEHSDQFRVAAMATVLSVSRSGYYAWLGKRHQISCREAMRQSRDTSVKQAFINNKKRYGSRRIAAELAEDGATYNRKTIADSMRRQNLVAKAAKKFKQTTNSQHHLPIAPNLLEQNFDAQLPNQKWVGDITYLMTSEGWLYLAVIIDLYSRMVIGWSMSERMTADLTCDALKMAMSRRGFPNGTIVHSDRGSQYCSNAHRELIERNGMRQSMSKKACCWDNACAESFFGSLKVEAIQNEPIMDREAMRQTIFEYIEVDYNKKRRHSALGYLSPEDYEAKQVA